MLRGKVICPEPDNGPLNWKRAALSRFYRSARGGCSQECNVYEFAMKLENHLGEGAKRGGRHHRVTPKFGNVQTADRGRRPKNKASTSGIPSLKGPNLVGSLASSSGSHRVRKV